MVLSRGKLRCVRCRLIREMCSEEGPLAPQRLRRWGQGPGGQGSGDCAFKCSSPLSAWGVEHGAGHTCPPPSPFPLLQLIQDVKDV